MASYNFYDNEDRPLWNRFASIVESTEEDETFFRSLSLWQETFSPDRPVPSEFAMADLLNNLKTLPSMSPRRSCPVHRLFVSHRRVDKNYALRIANMAYSNGFDFWLDVLNPPLTRVTASTRLSPVQKVLLTAFIIEMGLVNSTHVLAVMTQNTKGGEWVPYEYGRVRQIGNTACWQHPGHSLAKCIP
ncbi:toll/interleukin-1 receptor domain-containing protein [Spirosoma validum]|uniref:Toll/interleukin-1 receptor domain-containing protein n=1 Tax=Spirosoma validum TaxID=2771355 RepID=A0A927B4A8_9BACT|nr:toll/interleukin-1 receptor domain-containing protein [Spirosoma validum]MBD2754947.1 toll/interleukin-1 receptor domain-containing protein [Spirosoma validum]